VQGGRTRPQLTTWIFSEIINSDVPQVDLSERHGLAVQRGFRFCVNIIYENTHPLLTGAVRIDSTTSFSGGLDFDALSSGTDGVTGIDSLNDKIWMAVEVLVFPKGP